MTNDDILKKAARVEVRQVRKKLDRILRDLFRGPFGWALMVVTAAGLLAGVVVGLVALAALAALTVVWVVAAGTIWLPWRVFQAIGRAFSPKTSDEPTEPTPAADELPDAWPPERTK